MSGLSPEISRLSSVVSLQFQAGSYSGVGRRTAFLTQRLSTCSRRPEIGQGGVLRQAQDVRSGPRAGPAAECLSRLMSEVLVPRLAQLILLELPQQVPVVDSQAARRHLCIALRRVHDLHDLVTLKLRVDPLRCLLESPRQVKVIPRVTGLLPSHRVSGQAQVTWLNLVSLAKDHGSFDTVLQLADVFPAMSSPRALPLRSMTERSLVS